MCVVYDFEGVASFPHFMSSLFLVQTRVYNSNIATGFVNTDMLTICFRCGSDISVINKRPWNVVNGCFERISSVCYGYFVLGCPSW